MNLNGAKYANVLMSGDRAGQPPGFVIIQKKKAIFYRNLLQMPCSLKIYKWKANFTGFMRTFNILSV